MRDTLRGEWLAAAGKETEMERDTRKTVLECIAEDRDWSTYKTVGRLVTDAERESLDSTLQELLLAAASHHDDENALRFAKYAIRVERNKIMLPFWAKIDARDKKKVYPDCSHEHIETQGRADVAAAKKAKALFLMLPRHNEEAPLASPEQVRPALFSAHAGNPTLSKTKEYLLLEVANGWKSAQTEEADALFDFILSAPLHSRQDHSEEEKVYHGEINIRRNALRLATNESFPPYVIARTLASIANARDRKSIGILVSGWWKFAPSEKIPQVFLAALPFLRAFKVPSPNFSHMSDATNSRQIVEYARSLGDKLSAIDEKVACLLEQIGRHGTSFRYDPDSDPRMPTVDIALTGEFRETETAHSYFDGRKSVAEEWLKKNNSPRAFRVRLTFSGRKQFDSATTIEREAIL